MASVVFVQDHALLLRYDVDVGNDEMKVDGGAANRSQQGVANKTNDKKRIDNKSAANKRS